MSFTKTFPVDHKNVDLTKPKALLGRLGTVSCYPCVDNDTDNEFIIMVSGYKDAWCGEYLLSEVLIATDEQVNTYKKERKIKE